MNAPNFVKDYKLRWNIMPRYFEQRILRFHSCVGVEYFRYILTSAAKKEAPHKRHPWLK